MLLLCTLHCKLIILNWRYFNFNLDFYQKQNFNRIYRHSIIWKSYTSILVHCHYTYANCLLSSGGRIRFLSKFKGSNLGKRTFFPKNLKRTRKRSAAPNSRHQKNLFFCAARNSPFMGPETGHKSGGLWLWLKVSNSEKYGFRFILLFMTLLFFYLARSASLCYSTYSIDSCT